MAREVTFTAEVKMAGVDPYVDVPRRVVEGLGGGRKVPVLVKVARVGPGKEAPGMEARRLRRDADRLRAIGRLAAGGWFRTTAVPRRGAPHRLYLDTWMREAAGVEVADRARIRLRADRGAREVEVPAALAEALDADPQARQAWEALAPSARREILSYLSFLKTPAALQRNVDKTLARLRSKDGSR